MGDSHNPKLSETPKFVDIAGPECKCTPDRLCRRCAPSSPGAFARYIDQIPDRFRGKFREPWNAVVTRHNAKKTI